MVESILFSVLTSATMSICSTQDDSGAEGKCLSGLSSAVFGSASALECEPSSPGVGIAFVDEFCCVAEVESPGPFEQNAYTRIEKHVRSTTPADPQLGLG